MSTYGSVLPSPQEEMREGPRDTEKVRHERETETGLEKDRESERIRENISLKTHLGISEK